MAEKNKLVLREDHIYVSLQSTDTTVVVGWSSGQQNTDPAEVCFV